VNLKVAFLAIGEHGDCSVITFDGPGRRSCIVIDGGEGGQGEKALTAFLKKENVREIDLLIGSHLDADHINGLKMFVKIQAKAKEERKPYIAIHNYWGPLPREGDQADYTPQSAMAPGVGGAFVATQQYVIESVKQNEDLLEAIRKLVPAQNIHFPSREVRPPKIFNNIILEILGPDVQVPASTFENEAMALGLSLGEGGSLRDGDDISKLVSAVDNEVEALAQKVDRTINNQSIVVRLIPSEGNKKWQFLFPGDAAQESWDDMTGDASVCKELAASVLKIPHHGSALHGINLAGVKAVRPQYAVNLVGQKHGLPDKPTLALLQGTGCKILCTQRNNDPKHKSACFGVSGAACPAKNDPEDVVFTIDTETGKADIEPNNRNCLNQW
jgi:beta-lactamase superfamily II metal-dependent hydrolase